MASEKAEQCETIMTMPRDARAYLTHHQFCRGARERPDALAFMCGTRSA
jgi:hypothetical protein